MRSEDGPENSNQTRQQGRQPDGYRFCPMSNTFLTPVTLTSILKAIEKANKAVKDGLL